MTVEIMQNSSGDLILRFQDMHCYATRQEVLFDAMDMLVPVSKEACKFYPTATPTRDFIATKLFLQMHKYAAIAIYGLTEDGYTSMVNKAHIIQIAHQQVAKSNDPNLLNVLDKP